MAMETMTSDATLWPAVGNPPPAMSEDPNPEWEMIAEGEENNATNLSNNSHVLILPGTSSAEAVRTNSGLVEGRRPRSATIGGGDACYDAVPFRASTGGKPEPPKINARRTFRRCASTPDLLMSDSAHEVIAIDESDEEEADQSSEDAELIEAEEEEDRSDDDDGLGESFEVLSDERRKDEEDDGSEEEPVMIDEDTVEESATLVSTPSVGTSSWTMASSAVPASTATTSVWGMKKTLSFKDMLAKNITDDPNTGIFGKDKAMTEARLRDSHRRHHLRVRTKPKFVVTEKTASTETNAGMGGRMMTHAHSTGDLTKMLHAVEGGHESSFGQGGRNRRVKKQLSAMMEEEDEEGDFVIGRGSGGNASGGGGGGRVEVLGDTDAMDYYERKEHGSRSASNKKKERPDEAKRREIIMHKKDMQRKKQAESQKGGGGKNGDPAAANTAGGKKKKKNDKGFGGKKERRRL